MPMSILANLKALLRPASTEAGQQASIQSGPGQLPSAPLPKPPTRPQAIPSFKTQIAKATSAIPRLDRRLANTDITTYRGNADTRVVVRDFAASNPDLSATINSYLRVGIPEKYSVIARDFDGTVNVDATKLAQEILRRLTFLGDPSLGYNPNSDLQSLSEALGRELLLYGSMAVELALDTQRLPLYLNAVSVTKLQFKEEDGGVYPVQVLGGEEKRLDIPTFFYLSIDQDLLTPYSSSYIEPAIQACIADSQFMNDLRKAMARALQPRLVAKILEEKVKDTAPPEVASDPDKMRALYTDLIGQITAVLSNLQPEDALVSFDNVEYSTMNADSSGGNVAQTMQTVQKLIESKLAAGAKTLPAVLGRDSTGTAATTSSMLFLKNANIIRTKLNVIYSRALTQAVRLQGQDVYVEFKYAELDLRPQAELEAYKAMEQSRILEQLSLGLISDEEACILLTGNLPPEGYKPLAGSMFKSGTSIIANPNSQTSTMNKGGAPDKLKPNTPAAPKS